MIRRYFNRISRQSREKKLHYLLTELKPTVNDKFLEVGVASEEYSPIDNYLIKNYPYRHNITALGLGDLSEFRNNYPDVTTISYDGETFPFKDKEFDIAHSNAVIEHVGSIRAQEIFLKEMVRVAKRGMITTPNKYFPIELHTKIPILHWLAKNKFDVILNVIGKKWASGEYMYLLTRKDLEMLARNSGLTNYHMVRNRFCGLTMTFSLIWQ
jgi:hypothetical protein